MFSKCYLKGGRSSLRNRFVQFHIANAFSRKASRLDSTYRAVGRPLTRWVDNADLNKIALTRECEVFQRASHTISAPIVAGNNRNNVHVPFFQPSNDNWW